MTTPHTINSSSRSPLRLGLLLIPLVLACFAFSPQARAVCQDACLTNFNTVQGDDALFSLTTGTDNTAVGFVALFSNTSGSDNTATGFKALEFNTTGNDNTATGVEALSSNTTGGSNTATGESALVSNTEGNNNTANGYQVLFSNTTGNNNTANGVEALFNNTTGNDNTANGFNALLFNTGDGNTANGASALQSNTTGNSNTANGFNALMGNTEGFDNTANGVQALLNNTTGANNTANGVEALAFNTTGTFNTADGLDALFNNTTGSSNIAVGVTAGSNLTTGSNNIDIGSKGQAGESNTIRIGKRGTQTATIIAGIRGTTVTGGVAVMIDANGRLGTVTSSARYKDGIKPMDKASEAILGLKPVTFHYKSDSNGTPQFGLIAEEVAQVNPDLVVRDENGEIYTVRYEAVNAMLLNEFLKEHRTVEELEAKLAQQQKDFTARLKEQDAKIQNVSDKVEFSKPAPRTVDNNQ